MRSTWDIPVSEVPLDAACLLFKGSSRCHFQAFASILTKLIMVHSPTLSKFPRTVNGEKPLPILCYDKMEKKS